jgi:outer membrane protein assembly factor BamB
MSWYRRGMSAVAVAGLALAAPGCLWAQPRADAGHTGVNGLEQTLTAATVGDLEQAWSVDGLTDVGNVVVAKGTAVVRSGITLHAYDARTGAPRWTADAEDVNPGPFPYGPPTITDPTIVGDAVVVGYQVLRLSAVTHNELVAYDLATGDQLPTTPPLYSRVSSESTITVAGDLLWGPYNIFTGGIQGQRLFGIAGATLDGSLQVLTSEFTDGQTAVAVGDGIAAYGAPGGRLEAIDAAGTRACETPPGVESTRLCEPLWSLALGDVVETPVVRGGTVYATTPASLFALTLPAPSDPVGTTPEPLWAASVPGGTAPAVSGGGDAYVGSSAGGGRLEAYDGPSCPYGSDCAPAWVGPVGGAVSRPPSVAADVVYVASGSTLSAFAAGGCGAASCDPLWAVDAPGTVTSEVSVAGGRVYVTTGDTLVAYGLPA